MGAKSYTYWGQLVHRKQGFKVIFNQLNLSIVSKIRCGEGLDYRQICANFCVIVSFDYIIFATALTKA